LIHCGDGNEVGIPKLVADGDEIQFLIFVGYEYGNRKYTRVMDGKSKTCSHPALLSYLVVVEEHHIMYVEG